MIRRSQPTFLLLCSVLVLLSLCGAWPHARLCAQSIPRVTVCETADADKLNPFLSFTATGNSVGEYIFFSLLRTDKATGAFVPLLASGLPQVSDDQLSYVYTIHPLAKFNNGKKITARDVVFSFMTLRNPFVENGQQRSQYDAIVGIQALDEARVAFKLSKPNSQAMRLTGEFAVLSEDFFDPTHSLEGLTLKALSMRSFLGGEKEASLKAVAERINLYGSSMAAFSPDPTCGSYVPVSWKRGSEIVLQANKHFWGRKLATTPNEFFAQNVEEIRIEVSNDPATIRKGVFERRYDLVSSTPRPLFASLIDIPTLAAQFDFINLEGPSYEYIGMNMRAGDHGRNLGLEELAVRQALAEAIYVDELMVKVCSALGTRIAVECAVSRPEARNGELPLRPYDAKAAGARLAAAGWTDADGNGIREKVVDGEERNLVLECIYNENRPERKLIAEHLQAKAKEVGILVSLNPLTWDEYLAKLEAGDFDLYIGAWVSDPNEDTYRQVWHTQSIGEGSNFVGFGDEMSDRLIEYYDETTEPEAHVALGKEIQRIIYDQQPYIFLWANNQCLIRSKRYSQVPTYGSRPGYWIASWK